MPQLVLTHHCSYSVIIQSSILFSYHSGFRLCILFSQESMKLCVLKKNQKVSSQLMLPFHVVISNFLPSTLFGTSKLQNNKQDIKDKQIHEKAYSAMHFCPQVTRDWNDAMHRPTTVPNLKTLNQVLLFHFLLRHQLWFECKPLHMFFYRRKQKFNNEILLKANSVSEKENSTNQYQHHWL